MAFTRINSPYIHLIILIRINGAYQYRGRDLMAILSSTLHLHTQPFTVIDVSDVIQRDAHDSSPR